MVKGKYPLNPTVEELRKIANATGNTDAMEICKMYDRTGLLPGSAYNQAQVILSASKEAARLAAERAEKKRKLKIKATLLSEQAERFRIMQERVLKARDQR